MIQFRSFLMGGFECADHINRSGDRVSMLHETAHTERVHEDYRLLNEAGIYTVREGICWSQVEPRPYVYDFSEVITRIQAGLVHGIQQVWDICHFGYPDDLMPTHPKFADRFAAVCKAFTICYNEHVKASPVIVPINEISFLSWHAGDVRGTVPFAVHSGFDQKYHLCRAAIKGIQAIREADPHACIMLVEPLVSIHGLPGWNGDEITRVNEDQFQAMDIIAGRMCPELGGKPEYLQLLGFNYYYNNQWLHCGPELCWQKDRQQMHKLSAMLMKAYRRYGCPVVLTETGHFSSKKDEWITYVANECREALEAGVDLRGVCIYPVIDRPDWDDLKYYCSSGIWDMDEEKNRRADVSYLHAIIENLSGLDVLHGRGMALQRGVKMRTVPGLVADEVV